MTNASLLRRLGAILYDSLLLFAICMLATLPFVIMRGGESVEPGNLIYRLSILLIISLFFTIYWSRYGRTLGMQAWRILIVTPEGKRPNFTQANLRFFAAILSLLPLGLGFWWQLFDREGLSWHDRLSGTRLRHFPKNASS